MSETKVKRSRHRAREVVSVHAAEGRCVLREAGGLTGMVRFTEMSKRELVRAGVKLFPASAPRDWQALGPLVIVDLLLAGECAPRRDGSPVPDPVPAADPMPADPFPAMPATSVTLADVKQVVAEAIAAAMGGDKPEPKPAGDDSKQVHPLMDRVLRVLDAPCPPGSDPLNVYLYGPPGTGKTTLAMQVADALGVSFGCISLSPMPASAKIIGFTDANGRVTRTAFREAFESGGLFLFDEIDAGNAGDLTIINSALANRVCAFPDKVVRAHPKFYAIAAANTIGKGADENHTGRARLDAATTDRFERIMVPIDEKFERMISLAGVPADRLAECSAAVDLVQGIRKKVGDVHLVSPRSSISAVRLTLAGFSHEEIVDMRVLADASDSVRARAGWSVKR